MSKIQLPLTYIWLPGSQQSEITATVTPTTLNQTVTLLYTRIQHPDETPPKEQDSLEPRTDSTE